MLTSACLCTNVGRIKNVRNVIDKNFLLLLFGGGGGGKLTGLTKLYRDKQYEKNEKGKNCYSVLEE